MKLGKLPARRDPRTLRLADYLVYGASAPQSAHWGHDISYPMLGNDQYGDCVEAAYAHQCQVWATRSGHEYTPTTAEVLHAYSAITGFDPNNPATDQGTNMLDACKMWRTYTPALDAFATVDPRNSYDVKLSVQAFGGLYIGLALPLSAQDQVGRTWEVTTGYDSRPGSWGGHCVPVTGYGPHGLYCVTWGQFQVMDWDFLETYCDEAYALLSHEWMTAAGISPSHLAWGQLTADLANL